MNIGKLASLTSISTKLIRHYEEIGLLPDARREDNGYRTYDDSDAERLGVIRRARDMGFLVSQIRDLLDLVDQANLAGPCVQNGLQEPVIELNATVRRLSDERELSRYLNELCLQNSRADGQESEAAQTAMSQSELLFVMPMQL